MKIISKQPSILYQAHWHLKTRVGYIYLNNLHFQDVELGQNKTPQRKIEGTYFLGMLLITIDKIFQGV